MLSKIIADLGSWIENISVPLIKSITALILTIWFLVLLSKSLSTAGKISESKITLIVIATIIALIVLAGFFGRLLFPIFT